VINLSKSYGRVLAVDQPSFTVPDGSVTGFAGPNGSGKSTVLRAIAQLVMPNSGKVRIDGRETRGLDTSGRLPFVRGVAWSGDGPGCSALRV